MIATPTLLIVDEPPNGKFLAERFVTDFQELSLSLRTDIDAPDDPEVLKLVDFALDHGLDLRKFQLKVIELYNHYGMCMYDDDLVQAVIEEREHPDIHDIIEIIKHFHTTNPTMEILSIVPVDLKGTMGFIVRGNADVQS